MTAKRKLSLNPQFLREQRSRQWNMKIGKTKPKFDFITDSVTGFGLFKNRTTGEVVKRNISRENLSRSALIFFGFIRPKF